MKKKSFITSGIDSKSFLKLKVANEVTLNVTEITEASLDWSQSKPSLLYQSTLHGL